jgi:hypothetical protein
MVRKAVIVRETLKVAERTERLRKASAVAFVSGFLPLGYLIKSGYNSDWSNVPFT